MVALVNAEIFEPNQEGPAPSETPARADFVPRALLVSRQPNVGYSNIGVRVPTPPDNVPDVVTYLTT